MVYLARRSSTWTRSGLIVVLVAIIAAPGHGESPGSDAWENRPPDGLQGCALIDSALIAPVPVANRLEATAKLENVAITELDPRQLSAHLDLPSDANTSGANRIK